MLNNIENCWFYKLCSKQARFDKGTGFVGFIIGCAMFVIGVLLIIKFLISLIDYNFGDTHGESIMPGLFVTLIGGGLVLATNQQSENADESIKRARETLLAMSPEDFRSLGVTAPKEWYQTFYFTEKYLCIVSAGAVIKYEDISSVSFSKVQHRNHYRSEVLDGYTVTFFMKTSSEPKMPVRAPVLYWQLFNNTKSQFCNELKLWIGKDLQIDDNTIFQ
ncbi:MAG: hypothetical protein IIZ73_05130 [Ruminococcus sp.]|nr:hypothetical protein [Ruminococcus sp.]